MHLTEYGSVSLNLSETKDDTYGVKIGTAFDQLLLVFSEASQDTRGERIQNPFWIVSVHFRRNINLDHLISMVKHLP